MAKYTVKTRTDVVRENMALTNNAYGGWMAVNSGVDAVTVNGITLLPGEVLDFTKLSPDVIWDEPIKNSKEQHTMQPGNCYTSCIQGNQQKGGEEKPKKKSPWWLLPLTYLLSNLS